jgi:transcriptional regulator with XRE-family HTH domain
VGEDEAATSCANSSPKRGGRLARNVTQAAVGRAIGVSDSRISAIECDDYEDIPFIVISEYLAVVGLELSARAYPAGDGLRDEGQAKLLLSFLDLVHDSFTRRTEVPLPLPGDLRAWDASLAKARLRIGVEVETRIRDFQAVDRRVMLKLRDSGWEQAVLLVRASRSNRAAIREFAELVAVNYPIRGAQAVSALREGRDPGGNCLILM